MTWNWCSASRGASPCWFRAACSSKARRPRSPPIHACARCIWGKATMADSLALRDVSAGYGETVVLERISLAIAEGDTLAVLGRNGVGKTTLPATVLGHTTLHAGSIVFREHPVERLRPFQRARLGIGLVPQEREIFPSLN